MCAVSAMHDYMRENVLEAQWTRPMFSEYQDIIRRLERLDENLKQPDCSDPQKAKWMERIEKRLAALEP